MALRSLRLRLSLSLLAVALLAVGTSTGVQVHEIGARLEGEQRGRAQAAAASVEADLRRLGQQLERELDAVLDPRGAASGLGSGGTAARRWLWAAGRLDPGRLDVLTVLDTTGAVLTSGSWPASLGALDPDVARYLVSPTSPLPSLAELPQPTGTVRVLLRWRTGRWGDTEVIVLAGRAISPGSLETLREMTGADLLAHCAEGSCIAAQSPRLPPRLPALPFPRASLTALDELLQVETAQGFVVGVDQRALSALRAALRRRAAAVAILAAALASVIGVALARRIVRPVEELAGAAGLVAAGDPDAADGVDGGGVTEVEGLVTAFRRMAHDMDRSRRELVQAERVAAWQEIAQGLAHELKNPLTPIQASMDILRRARRLDRPDFDLILDEQARAVVEEVGRLKELADGFARFARLPDPQPEPLDLETLMDGVLRLYASPEVSVARGPRHDPPLSFVGDRAQLHTALLNLTKNAVEASEGAASRRVRVEVAPLEGGVSITIEDDGPGVDPTILPRLFTPYVTTKGSRGTGLGLALAHRIVAEHRGQIQVDRSALLGGARFTVFLPAPQSTRGAG